MRTAIDSGGRGVISKEVCSQLRLQAGQPVDVAVVDGRVSIAPFGIDVHLAEVEGVPVAVPAEPKVMFRGPQRLTDD